MPRRGGATGTGNTVGITDGHDQDLADRDRPVATRGAAPRAGDRERGHDDAGGHRRHQRKGWNRRAQGRTDPARAGGRGRDLEPGPRPAGVHPGDRGRQAVRGDHRGRDPRLGRAVRGQRPRRADDHDGQLAGEPVHERQGSALLARVAHLDREHAALSRVAADPRRCRAAEGQEDRDHPAGRRRSAGGDGSVVEARASPRSGTRSRRRRCCPAPRVRRRAISTRSRSNACRMPASTSCSSSRRRSPVPRPSRPRRHSATSRSGRRSATT